MPFGSVARGGHIWVENGPGGVLFGYTLPPGPLNSPRSLQAEPVGAMTA